MSRRWNPADLYVHLEDELPGHITYEFHLDPPYIPPGAETDPRKWAGHYIGSVEADRFPERAFDEHGGPHGARVLQVQKAAGGTWRLVRTWAGGREKEVQLKQRSGKSFCPECIPNPRLGFSEPTGKYKTRRQREKLQAERERKARDAQRLGEAGLVAVDTDQRPLRQLERDGTDLYGVPLPGAPVETGRARHVLDAIEVREMDAAQEIRRLDALEARWRTAEQQTPQMELEAG